MGRNNKDFQESALYHGTTHPFEVGDVVLPAKTAGVESGWKVNDPEGTVVGKDVDEHAFATPDLETARHFAGINSGPNAKRHVFQVEPVDPTEPEIRQGIDFPEIRSKKGFKVIRRVSHE